MAPLSCIVQPQLNTNRCIATSALRWRNSSKIDFGAWFKVKKDWVIILWAFLWHLLWTIWIPLPVGAAASSICQIRCAYMPNWPSSIPCQADLSAWEQPTQLTVLIIKSTAHLTHALSSESLASTYQVQSSFRSKRTRLKCELTSARWEEKSLHTARSSIRSTAAAVNS